MRKVWFAAALAALALLALPGTSSAQHRGRPAAGNFRGRGFHRGGFGMGFNRRFVDPRFGRFDRDFDRDFDRRFFDPRFHRFDRDFDRDFDRRFFDPRFGGF
jgi:hypothetical protein